MLAQLSIEGKFTNALVEDETQLSIEGKFTNALVEDEAETRLMLAESHSKNSENFKPSNFNAGLLEN